MHAVLFSLSRPQRVAAVLVVCLALPGCGAPHGHAPTPQIVTTDVHQFVAALDRLAPGDSTCAPLAAVFAEASPGLRNYSSKFDVGPAEVCRAVRRHPARYDSIRGRLPQLDSIGGRVRDAFSRFQQLYPAARFPGVYFVVGNGISGGTTTNGREPIILIGTELIGSIEGLPRTITHELMHIQQDYPLWGAMTGGPSFLRGSVLRHSIKEGAASFLADLVVGPPPTPSRTRQWADEHEGAMWTAFQRDMLGKDYRRWLYNGWYRDSLGGWPTDLGYEVGYRITRAYYDRAPDKSAAIAEILHIRDFAAFVAASGYAPPGAAPPGN